MRFYNGDAKENYEPINLIAECPVYTNVKTEVVSGIMESRKIPGFEKILIGIFNFKKST